MDNIERIFKENSNNILRTFTVFMVIFWIFNDFGIRYIYGYSLLGLIFFFQVLSSRKKVVFTNIKFLYFILIFFTAFFSLLPSSNLSSLTIALTISMLVFSLFVLVINTCGQEILESLFLIQKVGTLFSLYLIITKIFPFIYWDYIFPRLSFEAQKTASELIQLGYGVPIGGSTTYANYVISIGILTLIGEYYFLSSKTGNFSFLLNTAIYFSGMLVMNRRSEVFVMVATLALLFILLLHPFNFRDFYKKIIWLLKTTLFFLFAIIVCLKIGLLGRFVNTFIMLATKTAALNTISNGRLALWQTAWELFLENPLFGIGWEQFMTQNMYKHEVHNTYLQFLCETGIVGTLFLMLPILSLLFLGIKQLRRLSKYNKEKYHFSQLFVFVGVGLQLFLFLLNIIDPTYYHTNYFCFFGFSVILLDYSNRFSRILSYRISSDVTVVSKV